MYTNNIKTAVYIEPLTDPFHNLAAERYLLEHTPAGSVTLYLWQNKNTVVIGRNQNPWAECNIALLRKDGGHLVRRLSGGGAVYHDSGNLNFTFLTDTHTYNLSRQLSVITTALAALGIKKRAQRHFSRWAQGIGQRLLQRWQQKIPPRHAFNRC